MSRNWEPATNEARDHFGDSDFDQLSIGSQLLCSKARAPSAKVQPLTVPIYHSSTYRYDTVQEFLDITQQGGYIYQRLGNPTNETAEVLINELEQGQGTLMYNSGLAAVNALFMRFLKAGDHLICSQPLYSGTHSFIVETLIKFGVAVSWVGADEPAEKFDQLIRDETKMIFVETPSNPMVSVVDLTALGRIGRSRGVFTAVDGTFATPLLQKPLTLGCDVSIHSCSKYLGGHTDLIGGCISVADVALWKQLKEHQSSTGSALSALDASLLVRSLKTLALRVRCHCESALAIARHLEAHPKVKHVWYPGLESEPRHAIAASQMIGGFGGMLSFDVGSEAAAVRVCETVRLINLAVSLGGTESLIEVPMAMTHGPMLLRGGDTGGANFPPGLIRLSVGLEAAEDLIADLQRALDSI